MKISNLIKALEEHLELKGDTDVYTNDKRQEQWVLEPNRLYILPTQCKLQDLDKYVTIHHIVID